MKHVGTGHWRHVLPVCLTDAIPAAQGQSLSLQKTRPLRESDDVVISPRMSKLRKKTKWVVDIIAVAVCSLGIMYILDGYVHTCTEGA